MNSLVTFEFASYIFRRPGGFWVPTTVVDKKEQSWRWQLRSTPFYIGAGLRKLYVHCRVSISRLHILMGFVVLALVNLTFVIMRSYFCKEVVLLYSLHSIFSFLKYHYVIVVIQCYNAIPNLIKFCGNKYREIYIFSNIQSSNKIIHINLWYNFPLLEIHTVKSFS